LATDNTSDGVKLTATSDNNIILAGDAITNGGYGINIAASTCDNNTILRVFYSGNTSGTLNDAGTGTLIDVDAPSAATGQATRANAAGTNDQVITHNLGKIPKLIKITFFAADGTQTSVSGVGTATGTSDETCSWHYDDNTVANTDNEVGQTAAIIALRTGNEAATDSGTAVISAVSTTTFTLNWTTAVAAGYGTMVFQWEVIG